MFMFFAAGLMALGASAAQAAGIYGGDSKNYTAWQASPASPFEVRVGVLDHDPGIFGNPKEKGADVNAEALFASPDFLSMLCSPRPHIGGSVNSDGNTSQIYTGLTWRRDFWSNLFGEFSFGPSFNDGVHDKRYLDRKALGSNVLFRESLSLGYQFDQRNNISVMLDHISNAGLAKYNGGMETVGLRYGHSF
jgi:lipid A 3-O-deacylase